MLAALAREASPADRLVIESVVQIQLRLSLMDRDLAQGAIPHWSSSKVYLAHSASQARLLRQLGIKPQPAAPAPTIADIVRQHRPEAAA
ncbi:hypothetical protein [Lichenicoccus roseus]|uniref:Uncharacterized protein n=1 Tax=Lichenicoccus roseus TaxID=2683649 RepID=A0A5R9J0R8_9PROT|nr:hypothetical protein [Lichenicoccus roseus]TLU71265.1 hypothetical protein FE263_17320 [Lichenicoccus roseus]